MSVGKWRGELPAGVSPAVVLDLLGVLDLLVGRKAISPHCRRLVLVATLAVDNRKDLGSQSKRD